MHHTSGILKRRELPLVRSHEVVFRFPRFYPSVPIEAVLSVPTFHPNVDSDTGFVCLWNNFASGDTILEALTLERGNRSRAAARLDLNRTTLLYKMKKYGLIP